MFLPPLFVDHIESGISIGGFNPARQLYFKIKGNEDANIDEFISLSSFKKMDTSTTVRFERLHNSTLETLELIVCYTYGTYYPNLMDLCDEEVTHVVEGTLGTCFTDFSVSYSQLVYQSTPLRLNSVLDETFLTNLYGIVELEHDEALGCGILGFRLTDETMAALMTLDAYGSVDLVSPVVSDESWLGLHQITFDAFLMDLDPEAEVMTWTLDFTIELLIEPEEIILDEEIGAEIVGSFLRE